MAAASRDLEPSAFDASGDLLSYVQGLDLTSLVGMIDPARDTSKPAVERAQAAHIRVRMVTGDDVVTGAAIATQLGIPGRAILGEDFAKLSEAERLNQIDDIGVVGRVAPQHKVLLVETLRKKGDVVAMTGDGVNDAPAIKAADIGIAMGTGTEVAKNAGRMILSDDNFATIIHAVEQGRKLYDNLTKYVRFILITLVTFVATFLVATVLDIAAGMPFTPLQILWINFLIDTPLGIALGFDAESPGIMKRLPRPRSQSILTRGVIVTAALVGPLHGRLAHRPHRLGIDSYGGLAAGSAMALTAFAWFRIVCAFECRSERESALQPRLVRQPAAQHRRPRRGGAGLPGHGLGRPQPPAGHRASVRGAVGADPRRRCLPLRGLGDRQADRPPGDPRALHPGSGDLGGDGLRLRCRAARATGGLVSGPLDRRAFGRRERIDHQGP